MSRDYAKQSVGKGNIPKRKKNDQSHWGLLLVALVVFALALTSLMYFKQYRSHHPKHVVSSHKKEKKTEHNKYDLEAKDEIKFDFYTTLPKMKINPDPVK